MDLEKNESFCHSCSTCLPASVCVISNCSSLWLSYAKRGTACKGGGISHPGEAANKQVQRGLRPAVALGIQKVSPGSGHHRDSVLTMLCLQESSGSQREDLVGSAALCPHGRTEPDSALVPPPGKMPLMGRALSEGVTVGCARKSDFMVYGQNVTTSRCFRVATPSAPRRHPRLPITLRWARMQTVPALPLRAGQSAPAAGRRRCQGPGAEWGLCL